MGETLRTVPIKLNEVVYEDVSKEIQILRTCTFYHDRYGKVEITPLMLAEMVDNFKGNTRGIDIMIDYAHNSELEAAGWIKELFVRDNQETGEQELWAIPNWTPKGQKTLSDKEYAYLSADFDPDYRDNENPDKKFGAVLLGAGLTNRPVVKKMKPVIQLSEYSKESKMAKSIELMEKELEEKDKKLQEQEAKMGEYKMQEDRMEKLKQIMKDLDAESVEDLIEIIANMKKGVEEKEGMEVELSGMKKELAEFKKDAFKKEKELKFNELMEKGLVIEAQREKVLKLGEEGFKSFIEIAAINKEGLKLSEIGHGKNETKDQAEGKEKNVEDIVKEKAVKLAEEKKIPMHKAMSQVLKDNKDLKEKYYKQA